MQMIAALIPLAMSVSAVHATNAMYQCRDGTRLSADFSPPSLKAGHVDLSIRGDGKVTLPQQMSADEVTTVAREIIAATGAQSLADIGKVMPVIMERLKGQAEGRTINQVVRQLLSGG